MVSIREKPWLGGLTSGIVGIVAILLPVRFTVLLGVNIAIWMWGLISGSESGVIVFEMFGDFSGVTISIVILYLSIIIFTSYPKAKKYMISNTIGNLWIVCGALYIISAIFYMILHLGIFLIPGSWFGFSLFLISYAGTATIFSGVLMKGTRKRKHPKKEKEKDKLLEKLNSEIPDCPACKTARDLGLTQCPTCRKIF